jgi:hypothetical protein
MHEKNPYLLKKRLTFETCDILGKFQFMINKKLQKVSFLKTN